MTAQRHSFVTLTDEPDAKIHISYDWAATDTHPGGTACKNPNLAGLSAVTRLATYDEPAGTRPGFLDTLDRLDPDPVRLCRRCFHPVKVIDPYTERRAARHHRPALTAADDAPIEVVLDTSEDVLRSLGTPHPGDERVIVLRPHMTHEEFAQATDVELPDWESSRMGTPLAVYLGIDGSLPERRTGAQHEQAQRHAVVFDGDDLYCLPGCEANGLFERSYTPPLPGWDQIQDWHDRL